MSSSARIQIHNTSNQVTPDLTEKITMTRERNHSRDSDVERMSQRDRNTKKFIITNFLINIHGY